jgi:PAS domain S-box-containing protein
VDGNQHCFKPKVNRGMPALTVTETPVRYSLLPAAWLRVSALGTFLTSLIFLSFSVGLSFTHDQPTQTPISALLAAMGFAIFLTACSLWHLRRQHQGTDRAFRETDCEFASIFHNVLDGILIVDDVGDCLDANPAAATILRLPSHALIGHNISRFLSDSDEFAEGWKSFLQHRNRSGRTRLIGGDNTTVFVSFAATTQYLPGRHLLILCDVTERTEAEFSLRKSEERFQQMANNIEEIFWMMDAATQEVTYVNRAYATITGSSVDSIRQNPTSYRELIHPEDRIRFLSKLRDVADCGTLDDEFRFIRADGEVRWAWIKGARVPSDGLTHWLVGTAQDVTSRKLAEMKIIEQLDAVEASRAEAEALRKSSLALSQNLAMDSVLDTLLQCISEIVPFDNATVFFVEDGGELMVAREAPRIISKRIGLTLKVSDNVILQRLIFEKRVILLQDVALESDWQSTQLLDNFRSWLGIPLVAGGCVLGILSLGAKAPNRFTVEHQRLSKSLAIPAAVAIQNARIHERAEIYAAELETRLVELRATQKVLEDVGNKTLRPDQR